MFTPTICSRGRHIEFDQLVFDTGRICFIHLAINIDGILIVIGISNRIRSQVAASAGEGSSCEPRIRRLGPPLSLLRLLDADFPGCSLQTK